MSDWHFGGDYDMWLYPPVDWTSPDYDYELPEPIEAANIEGELLVNAKDAIEQVRRLQHENAKLRERIHELEMEGSDHFYRTAYAEDANRTLEAENAKLREQMERLVTLLRVDCDIDASWDGLRRFWSIGLTENGCLMRDRACKAEAEADRLREQAARAWRLFTENGAVHPSDLSEVDVVRDGLHELGVEVDDG